MRPTVAIIIISPAVQVAFEVCEEAVPEPLERGVVAGHNPRRTGSGGESNTGGSHPGSTRPKGDKEAEVAGLQSLMLARAGSTHVSECKVCGVFLASTGMASDELAPNGQPNFNEEKHVQRMPCPDDFREARPGRFEPPPGSMVTKLRQRASTSVRPVRRNNFLNLTLCSRTMPTERSAGTGIGEVAHRRFAVPEKQVMSKSRPVR